MTFKKAMLRGLLGAPLGIVIGYTITIMISLFNPSGDYFPVVPQLIEVMGNEIKAVLLQYFLSAVLGFVSASGAAVYEVEEWSIAKQTAIHFLILTTTMFPIAYLCYWMDHTIWGVLSYIIFFVVIFVIIWVIQVYSWKKRINKINHRLQSQSKE